MGITPPTEMAGVLRRYQVLQAEEKKIKEEKALLQQRLAEHMATADLKSWYPDVDGKTLTVRRREIVEVDYNEPVLHERLGERYRHILAPDIRKIRKQLQLPEITAALAPVLDLVGAPSPDRVRAAIGQGLVTKEEFAGAFTKTTRTSVTVAAVRSKERQDVNDVGGGDAVQDSPPEQP
ncbi:MAG: hypothetical protein C0404_08975 [Verrucomicrobia bacterium]|nr:hypothetical protein [Verrucomicrobiota bacterium]